MMRDWLQYLAALLLAASPLLWPAVAPWAVGLLIAGSFVILLAIWWRPRPGPEYEGGR